MIRLPEHFTSVRSMLGATLLVSGAVKLYLPATSLEVSGWASRIWPTAEIWKGVWFLSGIAPGIIRAFGVALFVVLAVVSAQNLYRDDPSCGCFGAIPVSPWLALGVDTFAVLGLILNRPAAPNNAQPDSSCRATSHSIGRRAPVGVLAVLLVLVLSEIANHFTNHGNPSGTGLASGTGLVVKGDQIIVTDPARWVGMRLPLLPYLPRANTLSRGRWLVVFYRGECPRCQEVLQRVLRESQIAAAKASGTHLAILELPLGLPADLDLARSISDIGSAPIIVAKLPDTIRWQTRAPLVLVLNEANVEVVSHYAIDLDT